MSFSLEKLKDELVLFKSYAKKLSQKKFHVEVYDDLAFRIDKSKNNPSYSNKKYEIIFSALVHGNEVAGLSVLNQILDLILNEKLSFEHSVGFIVHNEKASLQNKRFLEKDLNRSFLTDSLSKDEEKMARRAESILKDYQFCVDFHQTNQPSLSPFFIFFFSEKALHWARFIDLDIPAIVASVKRHKDGSTLEMFCHKNEIICVTLELGVAGFFKEQIDFGLRKSIQALKNKNTIDFHAQPSSKNIYKILESIYWEKERINLNPGFINFQEVKKGDLLGHMGNKKVLSPHGGVVLFPKYGEIAENTKEVITFAEVIEDLNELKI